ncbi:MAG: F0F1 ATP synthase subunit delta [Candidatus Omnitrophica bacterium]|nr:F0F1 ATP synthase subunit delta [Candidatus Omnitrophota bacterium]
MVILQIIIGASLFMGVIVFALKKIIFTDTNSSINRLNAERNMTEKKRRELERQKKEFEEQCKEKIVLVEKEAEKIKMEAIAQAEEKGKEFIDKARKQAEETVQKAFLAKEVFKKNVIQEIDSKVVDYCNMIVAHMFLEKMRKEFETSLANDFLKELEKVDPLHLQDVEAVTVISRFELEKEILDKIQKILEGKVEKEVKIETKQEESVIGGILLQFGTMVLDGSLSNILKDSISQIKKDLTK